MNFRIVSKVALLLVIIGFFMPVSCDLNGFEIAEKLMDMSADDSSMMISVVAIYLVFFAAALSLLISIIYLASKKQSSIGIDWLFLILSIGGGIYAYVKFFEKLELQNGAYVIVAGWAISLLFLLLASGQKKE